MCYSILTQKKNSTEIELKNILRIKLKKMINSEVPQIDDSVQMILSSMSNDDDTDNDTNNDTDNNADGMSDLSTESAESAESYNDVPVWEGMWETTSHLNWRMGADNTVAEGVEEKSPIISISRGTQMEVPFCSICYKNITVDDGVVTSCGHHHCTKCFFRWIEVNATCPCCRAPINSKTNLTDEQLEKETGEVYQEYINLLLKTNALHRDDKKTFATLMAQKQESERLLRRQISLKEQIRETEGYNEGYLAASFQYFHSNKTEYTSTLLECSRSSPSFMRGFNKGILVESERMLALKRKYKKIFKGTN